MTRALTVIFFTFNYSIVNRYRIATSFSSLLMYYIINRYRIATYSISQNESSYAFSLWRSLTLVRLCKSASAQVNVMGCSSPEEVFFVELLHGQLCAVCSQQSPGSAPNLSKQALDGSTTTEQGIHSISAGKGGNSVSHNSEGLFMNPCMAYSSGLTHQTIRLVSVSSSDFGTMWIKTRRALINLACSLGVGPRTGCKSSVAPSEERSRRYCSL